MLRKLTVIGLTGVMCFLGVASALGMKYNEAPMLRVKVAAGELPSVEERLPEEPVIVEPEKIGRYGGTLNTTFVDITNLEGILRSLFYHTYCAYCATPDGETVVPELVKNFKISEDGRVLTLHLRKGLKWSDGVPFTANDIAFWYNNILLNKDITPAIGMHEKDEGGVMKMEKIDDYTVSFEFSKPRANLIKYWLVRLTNWRIFPAHYLKEFHIKYNSKANELAKKEGYSEWWELFNKMKNWQYGRPTLDPWMPIEYSDTLIILERNPYYWKVDAAGNQLPYIDRIAATHSSIEMYNMKVISGDIDIAAFYTSLKNYPLYKDNEATGGYHTYLWEKPWAYEVAYTFNLTYGDDPVLCDIFQDVRFRRAMSLAIDREEINNDIFFGKGRPAQATVYHGLNCYKPEFSESYAEYNPQEANRLLDEMGLKWDKNHEYRLRPDGRPLFIVMEFEIGEESPRLAVSELVKEYWEEVGVKIDIKVSGLRSYVWSRRDSHKIQVTAEWGNMMTELAWITQGPRFTPHDAPGWGSKWRLYYRSGGLSGSKPPKQIEKIEQAYEVMSTTSDDKEKIEMGHYILREQANNLWLIGTVADVPHTVLLKDDLHNVIEIPWDGDVRSFWRYSYPDQWFKD